MAATTKLGPGGYPVAAPSSGLRNLVLAAAAGSYVITGSSASLVIGHVLSASPGTYVITGASANFARSTRILAASPGAYAITGKAANFVKGSGKVDIDVAVTPRQLRELRARLAKEGKRRQRDFAAEARTRSDLRATLESAFGIAEPEVQKVIERLPVKEEARTKEDKTERKIDLSKFVDWPKLYDDRALMEGLTRDLGKVLAAHLEREREEDDLAILMMA